jgi:leucyl/phenylalanyl-tRNA---protein transferase
MLQQSDLKDYVQFPNPNLEADEEGIVAAGGELSPEFLISAYRQGIFPWFNPGEQILWWSPNPRCVLELENLHISKTMKQLIRKNNYHLKVDTQFVEVMKNCQKAKRKNEVGTWISRNIIQSYAVLHELGICHSFEVYNSENQLVGGLYGASLGKVFYGESMFAKESNCSKIAFIYLAKFLKKHDFHFLDCQVSNPHLLSLGASEIPRADFLERNKLALKHGTHIGSWTDIGEKFCKEFKID